MINIQLSYIITYLVNRSFNGGYFPKALKVGKQTPAFNGVKTIFQILGQLQYVIV